MLIVIIKNYFIEMFLLYKVRINIIVRLNNMLKFCRVKVLRFLWIEFWLIFIDILEVFFSCKDRMIKSV